LCRAVDPVIKGARNRLGVPKTLASIVDAAFVDNLVEVPIWMGSSMGFVRDSPYLHDAERWPEVPPELELVVLS